MQEAQARKAKEPADIAKFLADKKYTAKPTADSLFFLSTSGKSGKAIKDGDTLHVKYTLMLLDGTVIETSDHGPGHDFIPVTYNSNMTGLIHGWVEALGMMHEGEKATILLPSSLAYGQQGSRTIQPYTPLVFDMEVMKVISPKK